VGTDQAPPPAQVFVGVGTNICPEENVFGALELLEGNSGIRIAGISTFYRTQALPAPGASKRSTDDSPDYLNGVLELQTVLEQGELAAALEEIEAALGRLRTSEKYAPRTMDLDLLLFLPPSRSEATASDLSNTVPLPHSEIRTRGFVAIPLRELAPDLLLPPDGTPLKEVAASFPGPGGEAEVTFTQRLRDRFLAE
jgi:2-amino-4-hydroxy-6-hydroxymethyldihydropteridine diphosphokinase